MDSRLLNAFHDDTFDGNYVKYDTGTQFWSNESGTLGLQLTETLHGILPIEPTEILPTNLYSKPKGGDYSLESKSGKFTNSKIYENYYEDVAPISGINNKTQLVSQQKIETSSIDSNGGYQSDFLQTADEDEDDKEITNDAETRGILMFDDVKSCSRSTFRSRTDSSSIGDYESHSSDYDDDSEEKDFAIVPCSKNLSTNLVNNCTLNSDGDDIKKTIEDVDPFAMQLDVSTFDLATFITQDDQIFYNHSTSLADNTDHRIKLHETAKVTIPSDSDSDSDVIVDVETIENEEIAVDQGKENKIECFHNVKGDPSWSPSKQNVGKNDPKPIEPDLIQNVAIVPSKRQSGSLKKKFGIGRGKNINMLRSSLQATPKTEAKNKSKQNNNNNLENNSAEKKLNNSIVQTKVIENDTKNLIHKQNVQIQIDKLSPKKLVDQKQIISDKYDNSFNKPFKTKSESKAERCKEIIPDNLVVASQTSETLPKKRKLNLEEYKKRRENSSLPSSIILNPNNQHIKPDPSMPVVTKTSIQHQVNKYPQTEAVTSIVKSLKNKQYSTQFVDPITEAKNKVLRLQELKKAQQIKIIDSTVSSKVARVTKLPPLKDIVKGCYKACDEVGSKIINSEYEEIILFSTGCNTDITIPPNRYNTLNQNTPTNSSRSLLKSNALLANISNSLQKVPSNKNLQISSNSLIVSIQDVVTRKSSAMPTKGQQTSLSTSEHGEDKIIMHLRKDRTRKSNVFQSTQTDLLPECSAAFSPRLQSSVERTNSSEPRKTTKVRRKYRTRENSFSSEEESSNYRSRDSKSSRSMSKRYRRNRSSISSSDSEHEDYSKKTRGFSSNSRECSISSTERSSSRSKSSYHKRSSRLESRSSSRRTDTSRHPERNSSPPAVEERRIVYVGRIEQGTTKEMLRRKFFVYGPIEEITIHYKNTGMKYGFVTYEKSADAFRVIENGQKDVTINMYDISFGGRRAFCKALYADLDNTGINTYQSYVSSYNVPPPKEEDSFEALLLKVKAKMGVAKSKSLNLKT